MPSGHEQGLPRCKELPNDPSGVDVEFVDPYEHGAPLVVEYTTTGKRGRKMSSTVRRHYPTGRETKHRRAPQTSRSSRPSPSKLRLRTRIALCRKRLLRGPLNLCEPDKRRPDADHDQREHAAC